MDKRHFKEVFREFNFGYTIRVRKGNIFYVADTVEIDGWRTKFYLDFDECLEAAREYVDSLVTK